MDPEILQCANTQLFSRPSLLDTKSLKIPRISCLAYTRVIVFTLTGNIFYKSQCRLEIFQEG